MLRQFGELAMMAVALAADWVTPADIGWKGVLDWQSWALLIALMWGMPLPRAWLLRLPPPPTRAEARTTLRRAIRALACEVPRGRGNQVLEWWNRHVVMLVHVVFFYGFGVHLAATVTGSKPVAIGMGAGVLLLWLWHRPVQHKRWVLVLFGVNALVLFLPPGIAGVFVVAVLGSLITPSPATTLWELSHWRDQLQRHQAAS